MREPDFYQEEGLSGEAHGQQEPPGGSTVVLMPSCSLNGGGYHVYTRSLQEWSASGPVVNPGTTKLSVVQTLYLNYQIMANLHEYWNLNPVVEEEDQIVFGMEAQVMEGECEEAVDEQLGLCFYLEDVSDDESDSLEARMAADEEAQEMLIEHMNSTMSSLEEVSGPGPSESDMATFVAEALKALEAYRVRPVMTRTLSDLMAIQAMEALLKGDDFFSIADHDVMMAELRGRDVYYPTGVEEEDEMGELVYYGEEAEDVFTEESESESIGEEEESSDWVSEREGEESDKMTSVYDEASMGNASELDETASNEGSTSEDGEDGWSTSDEEDVSSSEEEEEEPVDEEGEKVSSQEGEVSSDDTMEEEEEEMVEIDGIFYPLDHWRLDAEQVYEVEAMMRIEVAADIAMMKEKELDLMFKNIVEESKKVVRRKRGRRGEWKWKFHSFAKSGPKRNKMLVLSRDEDDKTMDFTGDEDDKTMELTGDDFEVVESSDGDDWELV